jgi:hypothetical protein
MLHMTGMKLMVNLNSRIKDYLITFWVCKWLQQINIPYNIVSHKSEFAKKAKFVLYFVI